MHYADLLFYLHHIQITKKTTQGITSNISPKPPLPGNGIRCVIYITYRGAWQNAP